MYLLRAILTKKETWKQKLLKVVDDYDIYSALIGHDVELGEAITSPIRSKDDVPSLRLYIPTRLADIRDTEIWFKDMATGVYGDVFKFARLYAAHNFGEKLETTYDTIKFIDSQLELGLFTGAGPTRVATQRVFTPKQTVDLFYKSRNYTPRDLEYWARFDLDAEDLNFWNVKSIRYLLDEKGFVRREFKKNELCFVYPFFDKEKLYQPEAPRNFKFRNTCPGNDYHYYQGFAQLRGKANGVSTLIITKSQKDVMVFYKFFNKILKIPTDVIAPHAESINLNETFVEGIKLNYDRIICVSDYDLAGVKFANKCKKLGFEYKFIDTTRIIVNGKSKVIDKDISDFRDNNGRSATIKLLESWKLNVISQTRPLEAA